jgi:predicted lactoylglutathione lyase
MTIKLDMVGIMVADLQKSVEFYRRLGVELPEVTENQQNVSMKMGDLTFFLNTHQLNARWDPAQTPASGGYRILLEFYLKTREAVDAKYNELINYGYASHVAPYVTFFNMYFAMVNDPDGNTILLSGEV